ncbi:gamma-glutamyltransferase [Hyphococcus luteus]|uniref:Glutathione hydrolase proenzyme n=1 Tax=Hyphococcus luteus TaxID=2058213 RepID=A0A2S7K2G9_9PROT|nr:gamma-glutamyltransferase [Marinicaulis flavus]PQA86681.1 gamma-glutamyltransferase [Marinicaulis flavus]
MLHRLCALIAALAVSLSASFAFAFAQEVPPLPNAVHSPNAGREGMVVAEEQRATEIGADILAQGGNAVDAAVATAFALAVTYPAAGNLGGGGFMMVYLADEDRVVAVDYREMAPGAADRDMYLDKEGEVVRADIMKTLKGAGVPGTVAGLLYAQEKYGRLSRKDVMAPAIRLAEKGYPLRYYDTARVEAYRSRLTRNEAALAEFFKPDGAAYLPGETFKRKDLAKTLKAISKKGRDGFYKGWVADAIVADMPNHGGLISHDDLENYEVTERDPVRGTYRGYDIVSMPPPSSGGVHLIEMLNMLETRAPRSGQSDDAETLHFLAEVMRRAYADRAEHLGDPDYVDVPVEGLTSKTYAHDLAAAIDPDSATPSSKIGAGDPYPYESADTTHLSVIDAEGNMVANTYTLNASFGSGIVIPGTGVLMNNEMDDFSAAPGVPNYYGLVGDEKNAIAAGKRPLSSMTPTLVFKDGEPYLATGAQGGSRIITAVLQVIVNVIDRGMNVADATDHPRIHHQWLPDEILYEPGLSADTIRLLEAKGHTLEPFDWHATPQTLLWRDGWAYGYADERTPGSAACSPDGGC